MLSIGKVGMSRSQQLYYEEQVAKGREDYYAGKGEAPGRWVGEGARALGLSGELDREQLKRLMDGQHPASGEQLAVRGPRASTAALDLTFSAPKSVSVLFAVGDERLSRALVDAHEGAVDAALSYMEREACRVRRGHNGTKAEREAGLATGLQRARSQRAGGFAAAAYRHRMSRAQDPQLHTHVVCANMAQGADGRWTALDGTAVYEHGKAGGVVYEAHLRQAVRERLPWAEWGKVENGIAELVQVPVGVREEFSQRRQRILEREAELEAAGVSVGPKGRERIVYDTREAKQDIDERDWRERVAARAQEHGLGAGELDALTALPPAPPERPVSAERLAERLFSAGGLTATRNTFHDRDVVIGVADSFQQGAGVERVLEMARQLAGEREVVAIPDEREPRYTTRELLAAEETIVAQAQDGRGQHAGLLEPEHVERSLAGLERKLSDEQERAVSAIATAGHRIDTIEALAGTGKTTSAAALRQLYERAGYRVIGAAPTGRAVRELKERAGIGESRTLDSWALKLAADPTALSFATLTDTGVRRQPAVMIIDEAGMAHTRLSARVIHDALAAEVKVIAIGDSGQLSSVQAGGWLGALSRRLGSHELREVMRQRDPRERRLLAHVHRGEPDAYLELKTSSGELRVFAGDQPGIDAESALIDRWAAQAQKLGVQEAVMITRENQRRERLNQQARERMRELGELGESVEIGGREWAVGDRVIARRNDRGRDLDNGMRGTVIAVDQDAGRVIMRADAGGTRAVDREYVEQHLEHAYALTGHGMQSGTVDWAAVIGQPRDFSRNWSYTALSRAREPTGIYLVDEPTRGQQEREQIAPAHELPERDPVSLMGRRMRERDDEDLALEQLEHAHEEDLDRTVGPSVPEPEAAGGRDTSPVDKEGLAPRADELGGPLAQRARAVDEELARQPPWLIEMLGREPEDRYLQAAWQQAARQTAGWRIDHEITDPDVALGPDPGDDPSYRALLGTISDARIALELDQERSPTSVPDHLGSEIPVGTEAERAAGEPTLAGLDASSPDGPARDASPAAAAVQPDRPRLVAVPDPVDPLRGPLGPVRSEALQEHVQRQAGPVEHRSDLELAQDRDRAAPALAALDGAAAYEARRLEQAADQAAGRERAATERARALEQQAEQLGWRERRRRGELLAEARVQRQSAARAGGELADARGREQQLRDQARHPDDWLAQYGPQTAVGLAAERELAVRRERSDQAAADRAVEQPGPHIRQAIGERPQQVGEQRQRWDQLARDLEQHRLRYEIDVERDGITGPRHAPERQHGYQRQRDELSRRVRELQAERGLEAARETDTPDAGLDL